MVADPASEGRRSGREGQAAGRRVGKMELPVVERLGPRVWVLGAVMLLVGAVTAVLLLRDLRSDSYLYLAFYSIPANTAISVFPHEPVLIYFGKFANLWLAAAAATVGTLAAGWMDHRVFVPVLGHRSLEGYRHGRLYRKAAAWFARRPFATIVVAGFTPVPFWPFKFLSFSVGYPLRKYLAALVVGRFPRYFVLAWLGATVPIPDWILIGAFLVVIALYGVRAGPAAWRRWRKRSGGADARAPAAAEQGSTREPDRADRGGCRPRGAPTRDRAERARRRVRSHTK